MLTILVRNWWAFVIRGVLGVLFGLIALFMLGVPIGGAASFFFSGPIAQAYGWRLAMVIAAVPALVLVPLLLSLPEPVRGTAELYTGDVTGLIIRLPDWEAAVVINTDTGTIRYDNYNGAWGDAAYLHRFAQAYVVEQSRIEARKKSYLTTEQSLADGSILVEIEIGGTA